ncbi:isoprenoid synthase domain-containing protein [Diaporthe sp. PMI_573]|nr:isoprenoid synthase domain-containing protein [Diaporthaceae sp. PMI_573]
MVPTTYIPPPHQPSRSSGNYPGSNPGSWVKIPDLFTSIMSQESVLNKSYMASKAASDEWLRGNCEKMNKLDIAYMGAICAPYADLETLKLANDWNIWGFAFDGQFDEDHLQYEPVRATQEIIQSIAMLDDVSPVVPADESPLRHTLQSCWLRFWKRASPELQYRWKQHLTWYCLVVLRQVGMQTVIYHFTVEEFMDFRSGCVGYTDGIDLPFEIVEHPSLREIARLTCDLFKLQNDVCSYREDLEERGQNSIILDEGQMIKETRIMKLP